MKFEEKDWTIPLIYLLAGIIWIGSSDALLFFLADKLDIQQNLISIISQWKGYFYVALTSILLYYLIKRKTKAIEFVKNDFRRLFQDNPNPMYIFETGTQNILLANKAASKQYGYSINELIEMNLNDLRPDSEKTKLQMHLESLNEEFADSGEWLHKDKQGSYFYVNIYSHKTLHKGHECRIVNAINVNKKILAELERKNFEKALDKAALVSITDINGNIEEVNSEFCNVSGYSREQLLGTSVRDLESEHHSPKFWESKWQQIKEGNICRADIKNTSRSGKHFWVDMVVSPIENQKGEIYKLLTISYDITEKKDLQLNQEKLLDDFTQYAFQTSHELRGPLTSMMGLTSIFDKYEDPSYLVEKLKDTAEQMDVVIRKMNDSLSRTALTLILEKRDDQSSG